MDSEEVSSSLYVEVKYYTEEWTQITYSSLFLLILFSVFSDINVYLRYLNLSGHILRKCFRVHCEKCGSFYNAGLRIR